MPATNYDKWAKIAASLHDDTDSEEEAEFPSAFTKKTSKYIHVPAKFFLDPAGDGSREGGTGGIGGKEGKKKLCAVLEELPDFVDPSSKRGFTVEEFAAARKEGGPGPHTTAKTELMERFQWKHVGSQFIPGYNPSSTDEKLLWRVWYNLIFGVNFRPAR